MQVVDSLVDLVGGTPLVRMARFSAGVAPTILAKVEYLNPGGSVKDRIGLAMVEAAEKEGKLRPGGTIVEPTSGNTGMGLAIVAAQRGYKCVFVMPDKMSQEKIDLLRALGAEVIVCPTAVDPDDPRSYYRTADRLAEEIPGAYQPNQYFNQANPEAHYRSTGPELWEQTDGKIDAFVAGVGTGGTITGTGRYLKERKPGVSSSAPTPRARCTPATRFGRTSSREWGRTSGRRPSTRRWSTGSSAGERSGQLPHRPADHPRGGHPHRRLGRHGGVGGAAGRGRLPRRRHDRRAPARLRAQLPVEDLQRRLDGRERLPRSGGHGSEAHGGRGCEGDASCRRSSTPTPTTPCATRSGSCTPTGSARCRS
jgi:cysteine synthase